jgi:nitrogen fixation/metabolism regulation signal transduction histidine kinase
LNAPDVQVRGDPLRLRQLLHNLIKNAQEALDQRTDTRIIVTTTVLDEIPATPFYQRGEMWVQLTVEDNGAGFDAQLLERLFEPYVTTKTKGTGLGLAIVKKIVEEHGGIITLENTGAGALVRVQFPVWQAAAPAVKDSEQDTST